MHFRKRGLNIYKVIPTLPSPLSFHPLSAFYVLTLEDFYLWPTLLLEITRHENEGTFYFLSGTV